MAGSPSPLFDAPAEGAAPAGGSRAGGGRKRSPADSLPPPPSSAPLTARGGADPRRNAAGGPTSPLAEPQPSSASGTAAAAEGAESQAAPAAAAAAGAGPGAEAVPSQQLVVDGCTHCNAASSWRWRKHPQTQLRLCSTCWDYMRAHGGEERPVNVSCRQCGSCSPGTGRGVNGSWHAHPATGERWLCSPCFFVARRQAEKRLCIECSADNPGACKSAVWHRAPQGNSWLCTRCHGRAYEQVKRLRRTTLKREAEGEAAEADWAAAEHSARQPPATRRRTAATQQQERQGDDTAGTSGTATSQPTTPSMALEAAAGVLSDLACRQWVAQEQGREQESQLAAPGAGEQAEGWAGHQLAGQQGQPVAVQEQGAQLPAEGQAAPLAQEQVAAQQADRQPAGGQPPAGDLFELLLAVADTAACPGLTRLLVASFYSLLDGLPPEQKAVREWRLLRLLCDGSFTAAAQMMATALLLAGVLA